MKGVQVVIPVYNEESNIEVVAQEVASNIPKRYPYEIIFVDDGSTDATLKNIKKLANKNKRIRYLSLSRNFGHQVALKSGIDYSNADCVISLDGDLQHPPKYIPKMIREWEAGAEIVNSKRIDKKNVSPLKSLFSKMFYAMINSISDINILQGGADFRLLDKKVVDVVKQMNESSLFLRGLIPWTGFQTATVEYEVGKRRSGKTKYSIKKMILFALDGVTSLSIKPLRIATFVGFFFAFISGLYGVYAILVRLFFNQAINGWASVVTSVVFMGGVQLMILGIIGEYLGKLFIESKKRPLYIVKKTNIDR